jgi:hypothetical protein
MGSHPSFWQHASLAGSPVLRIAPLMPTAFFRVETAMDQLAAEATPITVGVGRAHQRNAPRPA